MSFEWRTEEESHWAEEPAEVPSPKKKQRRWPWLLLAVVLVGATAVLLVIRQLSRLEAEATARVEENLQTSYALVQTAAANRDAELFTTLLSGRDDDWAAAQKAAVAAGHFSERTAFGLTRLPLESSAAVISTTFLPALDEAVLVTEQPYQLDVGNGVTETVRLRQTAVYRLGTERWLLSPPEREFWGLRRSSEGHYLTLRYPDRDAAIGRRLAADLEAKLAELCASDMLICPPEFHLRVTLTPDPASWANATLQALRNRSAPDRWELDLPAPTLVGVPIDEAGYQALYRGYAAQVLTVAVVDATRWSCCQQIAYFQAALEWQLAFLAIRPQPIFTETLAANTDFQLSELTLAHGAAAWTLTELHDLSPGLTFSRLLAEFLILRLDVPPYRILASLPVWQNYDAWLSQRASAAGLSEEAFAQEWRQFIESKTLGHSTNGFTRRLR